MGKPGFFKRIIVIDDRLFVIVIGYSLIVNGNFSQKVKVHFCNR